MKEAWAAGFLLFALSGAGILFTSAVFTSEVLASEPVAVKIRDLTSVEGVRENPLIGYGMVVGLTQNRGQPADRIHHPDPGQHYAAHGRADSAGNGDRQECGGGVCDRQPAGVRAARHP